MPSNRPRKDSVEYARQRFLEDPTLSLDVVAKELSNKRYLRLYRHEVSVIRAGVVAELAAKPKVESPQITIPEIKTPPVAVIAQELIEEAEAPEEVIITDVPYEEEEEAPEEPDQTARKLAHSDSDYTEAQWKTLYREATTGKLRSAIRKRYLNAYLDGKPGATQQEIQGNLHRIFGTGVDPRYIYACVDTAREMNNLPRLPARVRFQKREQVAAHKVELPPITAKPQPPTPPSPPIKPPPVIPPPPVSTTAPEPPPETYLVSWSKDGKLAAEVVPVAALTHFTMTLIYRDGCAPDSIQVWKPAKLQIQAAVGVK